MGVALKRQIFIFISFCLQLSCLRPANRIRLCPEPWRTGAGWGRWPSIGWRERSSGGSRDPARSGTRAAGCWTGRCRPGWSSRPPGRFSPAGSCSGNSGFSEWLSCLEKKENLLINYFAITYTVTIWFMLSNWHRLKGIFNALFQGGGGGRGIPSWKF